MKTSASLSIAALALASFAGPAGAAGEPIKIGVPTSRTGTYAVLGDQVVKAIQFSADEANAAGGIDGRKVEVKIADDEGNPDAGRRVGEKLALEGYKILTGSISSAVGLALGTQLNRWDAIYMSVVNKSPRLTGDACNARMFRANHSDDQDLAAAEVWLKEQKEQNWSVIAADYLWGRGSATAFKATAQKLGKTLKAELYPPLGTTDFAPYITQLRASGAGGLWVALSGSDAINFAKQARQFGLADKMVVFGHNFVVPAVVKTVGKDALGIWGNLGYAPTIDTPRNREFVKAWRAKFNVDPTDYEGEAYAGMLTIFEAVKKAKSVKPRDVAKAMNGLELMTPFGQVAMRAADHQLEMPNYYGRVVERNGTAQIEVVRSLDAKVATPPPSKDCKLL
jgi:branched-chain amino acid transport system substrate-binding protein